MFGRLGTGGNKFVNFVFCAENVVRAYFTRGISFNRVDQALGSLHICEPRPIS